MKTNLKLSSKMHLFIIISTVIIALGMAVGTICHFVANGFFNYGDDYASYSSVTVSYADIDFSGTGEEPVERIKEICDKSFKDAGVSSYIVTDGDTTTGGNLVYKFTRSVEFKKLQTAVTSINDAIYKNVSEYTGGIRFSGASAHEAETLIGGGKAVSMAAITFAAAVAFHFVYFAIRYKLSMALAAMLADVHNFALYVALLALLRVPMGSTVATYAVIVLLLTIIGTCFLFDRMRKNCKREENKKLTAFELSDKSANESFMINTILPACLAAISVVIFVLMSISSLSPLAIITPVLCSLVAFIVSVYGTVFFTPAVYSRFYLLGEDFKRKSTEKAKNIVK